MSWNEVKARRISSSVKLRIQPAEDAGVVAANIEDLEALQVQVAVQCLDEQLPGGRQGVEGPGPEVDCGVEFEVHDQV